jgi:hypothetical protein
MPKKEKKKKRPSYIQLVTSHGKKVGKTPEEQKEAEPEKEQAQEVEESKYTSATRLLKFWGYRIAFLGGAVTVGFMCAQDDAFYEQPKSGYQTEDLDQNGVRDWIVIRQDGHKVPLYGVEKESRIIYYTGTEMRRWFRTNLDYDSIENKLNE